MINVNRTHLLHIYPTPPHEQDVTSAQFYKWSLTGMNLGFSFSETGYHTKFKELGLLYYLPIAGGRIVGFILFPKILVLCQMQPALLRIWTLVDISISCDNNHYTMGTSIIWYITRHTFFEIRLYHFCHLL